MNTRLGLFAFLVRSFLAVSLSASGDDVSLADALDNHTFSWSTTGDAAWIAQTSVSHDGADAAESGLVADNGTSVLQTEVAGPVTISFCWKVSSQQDADFLRFYVDDVETVRISGEVDWSRYTTPLADGVHSLKWFYSKDASGSEGSDRGWVDQVITDGRACVDFRNTTGVMDGTSWAYAFSAIQAAVDAMAVAVASETPGGASFAPEVWVAEGMYTTSTNFAPVVLMKPGVDLYGGFAGTEAKRDQRRWREQITRIDGEDFRRCVEGADATIDGFRIEGGRVSGSSGAGMICAWCSPVVRNCTFYNNEAVSVLGPRGTWAGGDGGAMAIGLSGAIVSDCAFINNSAQRMGGAVINSPGPSGPFPSFTNCLFSENRGGLGGAMLGAAAVLGTTVTNCTFTRNYTGHTYGATIDSGYTTFTNCIVWGDARGEPFSDNTQYYSSVLYSDIEGGFDGEGNIDADPLFTDPLNGDYTLQDGSPCLDTGTMAGAPATDLMGIARPQGPGIDMGAYEKPVGEGEGEGEGQVPVCGSPGLAVLAVALSVCLVAVLWTRPSPARQSW